MGHRRAIHNCPIIGSKFASINKLFYQEFGLKVAHVFQIRQGRPVHRVNLKNGSNLRLDMYKSKAPTKTFPYQELAYKKGVNIPKIIGVLKIGKITFKVSEWVEGVRIEDVWTLAKMFEKSGEQIASLNLIKDPTSGNYISFSDFNPLNLIWTLKEEVYIIDTNIGIDTDVDYSVVKTLIMGLRTKNRIDCFLEGYMKLRDIGRIMAILEKSKWKWGKHSLKKETSEDKLLCEV